MNAAQVREIKQIAGAANIAKLLLTPGDSKVFFDYVNSMNK